MSRNAIALCAAMLVSACSAGGGDAGVQSGGGSGGSAGSGGGDGGIVTDGAFLDGSGEGAIEPVVAHLQGRVVAPEGTIPISGALVYLSAAKPAAIPDGVFCDRCVPIDNSVNYTISAPDGSFDLPVTSLGERFLVVQKGQFRRVRTYNVVDGDQQVPPDLTTLPGRMDKANGDDIPKMAVLKGQWDAIELSLAKLGLANIVTGPFGGQSVDAATAGFHMYETTFPPDPNNPYDPQKLLHDASVLNQYHIVFVPCSGSSGTTCNDLTSGQTDVKSNIQSFVAQGGKLYVTDYSYDFVRQPFGGYVDWEDQTSAIGSACQDSEYDAPAVVNDTGLKDWLAAMGIVSFEVEANWTTISGVNTVATTDMDGNPTDVTPKVWVDAQKNSGPHPSTISFERECGRVLFSTYHTEASGGLLPQELALLYVLLEVAVCVEAPHVR